MCSWPSTCVNEKMAVFLVSEICWHHYFHVNLYEWIDILVYNTGWLFCKKFHQVDTNNYITGWLLTAFTVAVKKLLLTSFWSKFCHFCVYAVHDFPYGSRYLKHQQAFACDFDHFSLCGRGQSWYCSSGLTLSFNQSINQLIFRVA